MTDDRDRFDELDFWGTRIGVAIGALAVLAILFGMAMAAS